MKLILERQAFDDIRKTVGSLPPETGGILLGSRDDFIVRKFIFDEVGHRSSGGYDPDVNFLNRIIKEEWSRNQLAFLGFVHSHPRGVDRLSGDWGNGIGDLGYIRRIFSAIPALEKLLVPILYSIADRGSYQIFPYIAERNEPHNYKRANLSVLEPNGHLSLNVEHSRELPELSLAKSPQALSYNPDLGRLRGSISLDRMASSKVVAVGAGGAVGLYEDLIRSGLGKLTVIDFDRVDATNLVTQGFDIEDIGTLKVDALGRRLNRLRTNIEYKGKEANLLEMSEEEIEVEFESADVLLFMTDDFFAQARGNLIGLKLQIPSIFAIVYEKARCSEITFVIPGTTPGCHRCAVSGRYEEYERGYKNTVRQESSTIFHTHYLNSCLGLLCLAVIHRNTLDVELGGWFGTFWDRNLIQLRMHPQYSNDENSLFRKTFQGSPRVFNFDAVWQKIEPEIPPKYQRPCPDCGGGGDLTKVRKITSTLGTFGEASR